MLEFGGIYHGIIDGRAVKVIGFYPNEEHEMMVLFRDLETNELIEMFEKDIKV